MSPQRETMPTFVTVAPPQTTSASAAVTRPLDVVARCSLGRHEHASSSRSTVFSRRHSPEFSAYRGFRFVNYLDRLRASPDSNTAFNSRVQRSCSLLKSAQYEDSVMATVAPAEYAAGSVTAPVSRGVVIAGNWKMNKTIAETIFFIESLKALSPQNAVDGIYLGVPFTAISAAAKAAQGTRFVIGAQNMSDKKEGAFTGEVSGDMLMDAGAKFVILGHSERRQFYGDTNEIVNAKLKKALADGLQPIVCVGESLAEREGSLTEKVLEEQVTKSLAGLTPADTTSLILAYEPIWAIGTGKTATPEIAQSTHKFIRSVLSRMFGPATADTIVIQYGGSVTPENVKGLMTQPDIDGALVGGASLKPESFVKLIDYSL
mmetsp:Transcript_44123/g.71831  ORF Transcript_44123/g.71831 Transcript_44123/m.71831 type:complete len:375 (+) Transcript_44123:29-1153(+)|eukprot:CAMPEP_0184654246 /NCGR_PEP_ID=MMETSP0308-20130426/11948_1 /TAXON_ID=38269 /ORGANISM="Gloeochaete witrockiana, Strain SAG 46.84" /LENGTH=374 /DNA_ID=CAMNT_0027090155 /DNA_START=21 /DNA_END=1145 /DNA_ORIENTATION=-